MPTAQTPNAREQRLRRIVEETEREILAYALRRVKRREDAADVVAETYLVAWRRIDQIPEGGAARLWLFGVARRQLANMRRGDARRLNLSERLKDGLIVAMPPRDESPGDGDAEVLAALSRLSEEDREILTLFAWDGLRPAEIATVMGLHGPTARSRLHRAKERLKKALNDSGASAAMALPPRTNPQEDT